MIAFCSLVILAVADLAWVASRARGEWARSDELSHATAMGITSLYLLAGVLTLLALVLRPLPIGAPLAAAIVLGISLLVAGLLLAAGGARLFGSSAKLYGVERGGLVEGGVYRFTRNPQYAGLVVALAGIGVFARSGLTLVLAAFFAACLWIWVRVVEEPHLLKTFGERYRSYCAAVPRFLGLPR